MKTTLFIASLCVGLSQAALAQADKYNITPEEQTICQSDAVSLCSFSYPDEDKLISCMKANKTQLSTPCLRTFEAGLKRRHLS